MSKAGKKDELKTFSHPFIKIEIYDKKYYKVFLHQEDEKWAKILDNSLDRIKTEDSSCAWYYLQKKEYRDFLDLIDSIENPDRDDDSESSHATSESSDTDDELIQKTLTRRLKVGSAGRENDEDHVSDSELEDVISICRRFRSVYKLLKNMAKRIEKLEDTVFKTSVNK